MIKYYTRACNFYYGRYAKRLLKKKAAIPLCGNKNIVFNKIEIFYRKKNKVRSKIINLKDIKKLSKNLKKKSKKRCLSNICQKKKFFKQY